MLLKLFGIWFLQFMDNESNWTSYFWIVRIKSSGDFFLVTLASEISESLCELLAHIFLDSSQNPQFCPCTPLQNDDKLRKEKNIYYYGCYWNQLEVMSWMDVFFNRITLYENIWGLNNGIWIDYFWKKIQWKIYCLILHQ